LIAVPKRPLSERFAASLGIKTNYTEQEVRVYAPFEVDEESLSTVEMVE